MSFELTDEQRAFRDVLHDFVDERIAPHAARYDRDQTFPQESFDACREMELPALGVPEAYGGAGADMVTQAIMAEEIARGCASTSVTMLISKLGMLPIMNFASEEIKHAYLPQDRHRGDPGLVLSLRGRRRQRRRGHAREGASRRRRLRAQRHQVLDHQRRRSRRPTPSSPRPTPLRDSRGITCFLVEKGWGVKFPKHEDKLGLRGSPTGEVVFRRRARARLAPHR